MRFSFYSVNILPDYSQSRVPPLRSFMVKNDKKVTAFNFTILLTSLDHVLVVEILLKSSSSREAGQPCSITSSFFKLSLYVAVD